MNQSQACGVQVFTVTPAPGVLYIISCCEMLTILCKVMLSCAECWMIMFLGQNYTNSDG